MLQDCEKHSAQTLLSKREVYVLKHRQGASSINAMRCQACEELLWSIQFPSDAREPTQGQAGLSLDQHCTDRMEDFVTARPGHPPEHVG